MRISTAEIFRQAVNTMNQQQLSLSKIQEQISTGLRLRTAADDPAAASRILNLEQNLNDLDRMGENAGLASQRLAIVEDTLSEINDNLSRIRELTVQANSGTLGSTELKLINTEIEQRFDALLQLSNRQDAEGHYLFAGNDQGAAPPFTQTGSTVSYSGDQGSMQLEIAPGQFVSQNLAGSEVFQRIPTGTQTFRVREVAGATGNLQLTSASLVDAGTWDGGPYNINFIDATNYEVRDAGNALVSSGSYTPGDSIDVMGVRMSFEGSPAAGDSMRLDRGLNQDIFTTVQNISDALKAADDSTGSVTRISNAVYAALEDLDQALNHVNTQRATVGSRLSSTETALETHDSLNLHYRNSLSRLQDLDYAAASSELAQRLTALQASQAAFIRVQGLSLFNYLN